MHWGTARGGGGRGGYGINMRVNWAGGQKRGGGGMRGYWIKLRKKEHNDLCSSRNIISVIKSRRGWSCGM